MRTIFLAIAVLVLAIIACGGDDPTPVVQEVEVTRVSDGCVNDARFLMHVNVEDGAVMSPGEFFEKIWRLENNGDCDWQVGYTFELDSGDSIGSPLSVVLPQEVGAGDSADVMVPFTAPSDPGVYAGNWRMHTVEGQPFGDRVSVEIVVEESPNAMALDSLKDEIFFGSSHPQVVESCSHLRRPVLVVFQPEALPVAVLPTREFYMIEGELLATPEVTTFEAVEGLTVLDPGIILEIAPLLESEMAVIEDELPPAELRIEDRGAGRFNLCIAGVPRDQEIAITLTAPDGQVYQGAFIWPSGSSSAEWLWPQVSAASQPVAAGFDGVVVSIRVPFGPFPDGQWAVEISGESIYLDDSFSTSSIPIIAVPDFYYTYPFDTAPVLPNCAS
jgi:hypothetical protein